MTDEITENGYTEGSYGLFGIAVFYGAPGTRNNLAYSIVWVRVYPQRENGDLHLCFGTVKNRRLGSKKTDIFGLFAGDFFFVSALCCNVTEGKLLLKLEIRKYLFTIHSYLLHKILNASLAKSEKVIFSSNSILYRVNFTL